MFGHLDPREWTEAWQQYVAVTPVAAWGNLVLVILAIVALFVWGVLSPVTNNVIIPIIKARRGTDEE